MDNGAKIDADSQVVILGLPKSGTSLLMTLLDSHEELIVFPVETRFFKLSEKFYEQNKTPEQVLYFILNESGLATFNDSAEKFKRESNNQKKDYLDAVDSQEFEKQLLQQLEQQQYPLSPPALFDVCAAAYANTKGIDASDIRHLVEKTPGNEFFLHLIRETFPNAKCIHVMRHPLDNMASFFGYQDGKNMPRRYGFFIEVLRSTTICLQNKHKENYYTIQYEKLASHSEATMRQLAEYLGIAFTSSLLEPTIAGGVPWKGNSSTGKTFTGKPDPSQIGTYQKRLTTQEIVVLEKLFGFETVDWSTFLKSIVTLDVSLIEKLRIIGYFIYSRLFLRKSLRFLQELYQT